MDATLLDHSPRKKKEKYGAYPKERVLPSAAQRSLCGTLDRTMKKEQKENVQENRRSMLGCYSHDTSLFNCLSLVATNVRRLGVMVLHIFIERVIVEHIILHKFFFKFYILQVNKATFQFKIPYPQFPEITLLILLAFSS